MKHYTTIEQSKKLLELGLNPESADMYYFLDPTPLGNIYIPSLMFIEEHLKSRMPEYDKGDIPCWSLSALLEMIPLPILFMEIIGGCVTWVCEAHELDGKIIYAEIGIDAIEAVCNTMCWLLENNYIEK